MAEQYQLKCRECGKLWGNQARSFCDECLSRMRSGEVLKSVKRKVSMIDLPVKVCTGIFVGVILVSMVLFHVGMEHDTWIDAFYRTISLLATGADTLESGYFLQTLYPTSTGFYSANFGDSPMQADVTATCQVEGKRLQARGCADL